ncbi:hypothetical protein I3760_09G200200 [Carya illinoinensis]|uniref:Uncharacterized protein n=1 Tax=Carya illinoinensis TaxID=32201 RepID=A0A922E925_CARIL|nr:hypothetical protein I3760_09G200200 [Carya illinoinensis]KAG6697488.1 hypothetical protein I3842_09G202700 [Carya illinoinensis]KAG6697489.1 hypothetical protein I3842_09G202700 [Carya illinoinensis]
MITPLLRPISQPRREPQQLPQRDVIKSLWAPQQTPDHAASVASSILTQNLSDDFRSASSVCHSFPPAGISDWLSSWKWPWVIWRLSGVIRVNLISFISQCPSCWCLLRWSKCGRQHTSSASPSS